MVEIGMFIVGGFKSIYHLAVELRSLNILIGANGSGKSNFIDAFSLVRALSEEQLQTYVGRAGGAERILHFGSKETAQLMLSVRFGRAEPPYTAYDVILGPTVTDTLFVREAYFEPSARQTIPTGTLLPSTIRERIHAWRAYHFHDTSSTSPMRKTADLHDNRHLRADGSNLAAFLFLLREQHEASYRLIRRTVQLVAPFFGDFANRPQALNQDKIRLEWRHRGSDAYFDGSSLSDGSLRFIALASLLLSPVSLRPSVILLDEPELGLHPYAITVLASLLKQASVDSQIIVATQSPILLDHFEPEDVLVAERPESRTVLRRLSGEQLKIWLEDYSLGQLWEKNELGGRPARDNPGSGSV